MSGKGKGPAKKSIEEAEKPGERIGGGEDVRENWRESTHGLVVS